MTDTPTPREIRMIFDPPIDELRLEQEVRGRRTLILCRRVAVDYWRDPKGRIRWYVVAEGRRVRQADGEVSRTVGRIAYWPDESEYVKHQDSERIGDAPEWVKAIVAEAHRILEGEGWALS